LCQVFNCRKYWTCRFFKSILLMRCEFRMNRFLQQSCKKNFLLSERMLHNWHNCIVNSTRFLRQWIPRSIITKSMWQRKPITSPDTLRKRFRISSSRRHVRKIEFQWTILSVYANLQITFNSWCHHGFVSSLRESYPSRSKARPWPISRRVYFILSNYRAASTLGIYI